MAIDRAWWNALIDDDGSGNTGTVWNKATIKGLLDSIDSSVVKEGIWTPFDGSGANFSLIPGVVPAPYFKIGRLVWAGFGFQFPGNGDARVNTIGGLPFLALNTGGAGYFGYTTLAAPVPQMFTVGGFSFQFINSGNALTNAQLSAAHLYGAIIYMATT